MTREQKFVLAGNVNDAQGFPCSGLVVEAFEHDARHDRILGKAETDKSGHYRMEHGPRGKAEGREAPGEVVVRVLDRHGRVLAESARGLLREPVADARVDVTVPGYSGEFGRPVVWVQGQPVVPEEAAKLSRADLLAFYRHLRQKTKFEKLDVARRAFPGLFVRHRRDDDCGEGRLAFLHELMARRGDADVPADADDLPPGATIHWFYTQNVRVKYTTDAAFPDDKVDATTPAADADFKFPDGTLIGTLRANLADLHPDNTELAPTYVQKVGLLAEYALSRYLSPQFGMRDPRNGSARMEYRIRDMPSGVAGQTNAAWSHVEVGPSNSDTQNMMTVPHELFHQVQYRYNGTTTLSGIYGVLREGGARLIEDSLNDKPNRYVDSAQPIFNNPANGLLEPGGGNPIRYAAGLLWKYFAEQHSLYAGPASEPAVGIDSYRRVLEQTATALASDPGLGYTIAGLRSARGQMPYYGTLDVFGYYDAAATERTSSETTWGNYLAANYMHGRGVPDARFNYKEDPDAVSWPGSAVAKLADIRAALTETIPVAQGASLTRSVVGQTPWSARYYRLTPGSPAPRMVRVQVTCTNGMSDPIVQVLRIGPGDALVDVHRSDKATYSKTINASGLSEIVVIVASRDGAGDFSVQIDEVASATDVMVTRWHTQAGREYEIDPVGYSWNWISPDVMVDNNNDGLADGDVVFGQNNKLKIRLRNRGNANASNIQVEFWYQKAGTGLPPSGWIPIQNLAAVTQVITGETLAAGAEKWLTVDWAPVNDGTNHPHWCVKAVVTVAGDPNTDNKQVFSNFHVVPGGDGDRVPLLVYLAEFAAREDLHVVSRGKWRLKVEVPPAARPPRPIPGPDPAPFKAFTLARPRLATLRVEKATNVQDWDGKERSARPREDRAYPIPKDALPPGVDARDLVTVTHVVDGVAVGGSSFLVRGGQRKR